MVRCGLELSGINTEIFKAHLYRAASVSAAYNKGCVLKTVLDTADWSSDKNFKKFCWRQSLRKNQLSFMSMQFFSCKID